MIFNWFFLIRFGKIILKSLKSKKTIRYFTASIIAFFLAINPTLSQSYQFSKFTTEQGLPQQYVYSLNQDNNGFIWIGTGDGISKFDGIAFQNFTTEDGLAENFISCSAQRQKNIIWLGHNKGGISRILNGKISTIVVDSLINSKITAVIVDQDNYVWATSQNGQLIKISPKLKIKVFDLFDNEKNIYSLAGRVEGNLLIGTDQGLCLLELDNNLEPAKQHKIKNLDQQKILCITKSKSAKNNFWIGTEEAGLYQIKFVERFKPLTRRWSNEMGIREAIIQNIEEDGHQNLWISTYSGLYKLEYDKHLKVQEKTILYNTSNGVSDFVRTTLIDREGNTWIGMYGDGLAMLKDEIFTFYSHSQDASIPNDTKSLFFQDSIQWYGLSKGILMVNSKGEKTYYSSKNGFKDVAVISIVKKDDELFLGTENQGLYRFNTKTLRFSKEKLIDSYLSDKIYKVILIKNTLWVATEAGLIEKNLLNDKVELYNTSKGLRHNSIYDVFPLKDGNVMISSHSNELTIIKHGEISQLMVSDLDQLMDIVDIETDENNNIWLATLGNGVFKQEADSFIQVSSEQGLSSDYCYSIVSDSKNGIWVGHRGAMSRINKDSLTVQVFNAKNGINGDFNKGAITTDLNNNIWFGTNNKIIKFNPKKFSKNTIPPVVSVKNIMISDNLIPISKTIELPYGSYKLKVEFIGINFKQPEGVKYQYFLEGRNSSWSESSINNTETFDEIDDGTYTFYVKACNNDGFCSEETLAFTLIIDAPFWKKWWAILLGIVSLILIFYLIIKMRERKQKQIRKTLELELDQRTKEVVKKSKELETKNKSITDSINYALRIQKSILPSSGLLKKYFPESFIFYQPRDIVSGDFYWYKKIGNKFIIACVDCTGHGVPGAFMSMISSTLFKEISHQPEIMEPSKFLYKLDHMLSETLKRSDNSKIHDGLDMSICIFDIETKHMTFSGAYRPLIIYRENELQLFKTTSFSIGGDDFMEKEFKTQEVQLQTGDIVYLFSDGFPDQFGGERGKKLYLKGFKSLIENSIDIKMSEQHLLLKRFFKDWRGENEQIDDVLVMGIKIA